jgi:catechol 2,3-dioxygenase-like lactoylglutathione lyase family enzyme
MDLAKDCFDIGTATNRVEPMAHFWQQTIGARFDHALPVRRGMVQHRHDLLGSVLKLNALEAPIQETGPSGYRELLVAQAGLDKPRSLTDPEGNPVTLVPPGHAGVGQIGVRLEVGNLERHCAFYSRALGLQRFAAPGHGAGFHAGKSVLLLDQVEGAPTDVSIEGHGWRYITLQVFKVDREHGFTLAHGAREGRAPATLGKVARISMIRDPDGNWIELSQRASITGTLEA